MNIKQYFVVKHRVISIIAALGAGIALGWSLASPYTKAPASAIPTPMHQKAQKTIKRKEAEAPAVTNLTLVSLNKDGLLADFIAPINNDSTLTALAKELAWDNLVTTAEKVMNAYAASHHVTILSHQALIAPRVDVTTVIKKALSQAIQQAEEAEGVNNPVDFAWVNYCQSKQFEARQNAHEQGVEESRNCMRVLTLSILQEGEKNFDLALASTAPEFFQQKDAAKEKKA